MKPRLELVPIDQEVAFDFIRRHHRHHRHHQPPAGDILRVGAALAGDLVGVACWGRPASRVLDDGFTAEITRVATDGTRNACSFLLGACVRMALAAGYRRVVTYKLDSEPGKSMQAAGFSVVAEVKGRSWSCPSRPRVDKHPLQDKLRLERTA